MDEDKRLFVAAQLLPSLVLDRETNRSYTREKAVEIAVQYADLLISKLSNTTTESLTTEQHNQIAVAVSNNREELAQIVQRVEKEVDKRFLIIERTNDGKLKREGRLNSNGTVEWTRVYS